MAKHDRVTDQEHTDWAQMALEGVPVEDIAKQAGRHTMTVYRSLWNNRVKFQYACREVKCRVIMQGS